MNNPNFIGKVRCLGQATLLSLGPHSVSTFTLHTAMEDNQFDVIILGTGLVESITAA